MSPGSRQRAGRRDSTSIPGSRPPSPGGGKSARAKWCFMTDVVILGAGMAGFGAAHRLHAEGVRPVMFEQKAWPGGHTASYHQAGGFIFDDGPHISFTKDERIQRLF